LFVNLMALVLRNKKYRFFDINNVVILYTSLSTAPEFLKINSKNSDT
jgi:hypothetical protein